MSETIFDQKDYSLLFGWAEYSIFAVVVLSSMGIGVFYGFFNKKNETNEDFLVGGRSMPVFPVTLSLVCSFISGVAMLGDPVEVYYYGIRYVFFIVSIIPMTFAIAYLYVPVFCELKLTSAYQSLPYAALSCFYTFSMGCTIIMLILFFKQYLEMRFDKKTRRIVSFSAIIHLVLYMPLTLFAPSLALDQVAGINKYISSAIIFLTCIAYSSMGGLKAVLWSDALQAFIMFGSVVTILFLGVKDVGGFETVWEIASEGGRINFWNFDFDPRTRYTVWTGCIGAYFTWLPLFAGSQGQIQRYLSVPNTEAAQRCLILSLIGLILVQLPSFFLGLVIYAKYSSCDPISVNAVGSSDQLVPLFVMDSLGHITGLPGLMASGLACGSLSSVSSALNAIPAIVVEDYVKPFYPNLSETRLGYLSKVISAVFGLISFSLIFVIAAIGSIVPFAVLLHGTFLGPTVGIFTLAFFFPWANAIGCISGAAVSIALTLLLGVGSTINGLNGNLPNQKLPLSTDGCYLNSSTILSSSWSAHNYSFDHRNAMLVDDTGSWKNEKYSAIINLFSVSYIWHPFVAVVGTVMFGLIFSIIVNMFVEPKHPVKSSYMSPLVVKGWRKIMSEKMFSYWIDDESKNEKK